MPVLKDGDRIGWAFIASDFVGTTGYSGKPIHTMVALDNDARVMGVQLVKHSEPIDLIGIPDSKIKALAADYVGLDLVAEAESGGTSHDLKIITGATVTIMVIDDSIVRAGLKVSRALGLGGLEPPRAPTGPRYEVDPQAQAAQDWMTLEGDGTLRRLSLDVGQVNAAFEEVDDPRAAERPIDEPPETRFIEMQVALVSAPPVGRALLGAAEHDNLAEWLEPGDHAIMVAGRGMYSFKGSGYVRGGIFDRIVLIQDDLSVRFRDRGTAGLATSPPRGRRNSARRTCSRSPPTAASTRPGRSGCNCWCSATWRRSSGSSPPSSWATSCRTSTCARCRAPMPPPTHSGASAAQAMAEQEERAAQTALWKRIWRDKIPEVIGLSVMLTVLTAAFFFQGFLTRSERVTYWFRMSFLTVTLVFLGWYANAQLSVVNLMALFGALTSDFSWQAFLLDPLTFILWFSVAAALIFWGRGAYCGWLCPFGALQELLNQIGRKLGIPQWTLPWGLHERLWPLKYMIFLGLFGVSLASIEQAEALAEVEPFKTAIVLNFVRAWPFVAYAAALLIAGLFVERFFCRYMCPLGAALAIPARLRMFDWLKRYKECGNPCQTCANECFVQAIHPTGEINPNECLNCMHCQVLYQSETKCPVVIKKLKRRQAASRGSAAVDRAFPTTPT